MKFLPNLLRQNTFCFKKCIFLLPSAICFSCSSSSPSSPQSAGGLTCHKVFTGYWILQFLSPPLLFIPWSISYFACSSFCLSLVSSPPSPPPPPHWATASFTQPLSRVLQVHILSNRQTFHSLFKDPFCHLPHSLLCCTQSLRQYWPRLLSFSPHKRLLLSLSCSAMDRT